MSNYKATFDLDYEDKTFLVTAKCSDVDAYDVYGLSLKFEDETGDTVKLPYNRDLFEDLEQNAYDFLYQVKYESELE